MKGGLRWAQTAHGLALAGRRALQLVHRGLGAGPARCGHSPPPLASLAQTLSLPLLVLYRLISRLRPGIAYRFGPYPKDEGGPGIVETLNCSLTQRCGVLVRKSCSSSKTLPMHAARIKICSDQHNQRLNHNQKFNSL